MFVKGYVCSSKVKSNVLFLKLVVDMPMSILLFKMCMLVLYTSYEGKGPSEDYIGKCNLLNSLLYFYEWTVSL